MYCQNIIGRESYLHTARNIVTDSLTTHALLERQAKALSKQHGIKSNAIEYNNAPNVSFL